MYMYTSMEVAIITNSTIVFNFYSQSKLTVITNIYIITNIDT